MHSTQTKKAYRTPVLNKLGNVAKLTKGKLGSEFDGFGEPAKYSKFG